MADKDWKLTDQEIAYIDETGADMVQAQEAKKQAYREAGGTILNPDALEDMYEALKNLRHTIDELIQDETIPIDHPEIVKITMQSNEALWAMNKALGC